MPIKLPKLQKRKSSGNVLEEITNPPEPSFKVFERPSSRAKSFDGGIALKIANQGPPRPSPKQPRLVQEEELFARTEPFNRGSNGTETSLNTAPYDSGASSLRLSSSSTNPSSIESRTDKPLPNPNQRPFDDIPVPPPPTSRSGFLKNTARTFSFGVSRNNKEPDTIYTPTLPSLPLPYRPDGVGELRDRQVTSSSASTATPPRLFDSDLALENTELDGFGEMFDNFKLKSSRSTSPSRALASKELPSSPNYLSSSYHEHDTLHSTATLNATPYFPSKTDNLESSPYSFMSQNSRDVLLRSPSPPKPSIRSIASRYNGTRDIESSDNLRRTATANTTTSTISKVQSHSPGKNAQYQLGLPMSDNGAFVNDPSFVASATLAARYHDAKPYVPKMPVTNKIMTPAQFEQYKKQREMDRRLGIKSDDSDESDGGDDYEEEDEVERDKKAVKQRKKQEANLAVYRQTMMKVTGEHTPVRPASGMSDRGRLSPADLSRRVSRMTLDPRQADTTPDEEDEDEDVPLGILAAHGFPNKNRPPTQIPGSRSFSPVAGVGPSQSAPSLITESQSKTKLPVFARNLPQDPYYGAGLVNQSNRESLAFHGGATPYMSSGASTAHPLHPAGLVGVIDGEEKARAWRRGSPNAQGGYELPPGVLHPGMMRSQTTPNLQYGMQPGMGPMLTPGDQAQMQMTQQMTQMMQVQMQWMEQMQQFMAGGQGPPPPGMYNPGMNPNGMIPPGMSPNGFLSPPQAMAPRPQSIYPGPAPSVSGTRAMSMINPHLSSWNQPMMDQPSAAGGYAPSIAPSERSNVGLASRYRPVSIAPAMEVDTNSASRRTSTFTSSTLRPFSQMGFGGSNRSITPVNGTTSTSTIPRKQLPIRTVDDDEDDEQGWAEMKAKKESKQRKWKLRKGQKTLEELYNA